MREKQASMGTFKQKHQVWGCLGGTSKLSDQQQDAASLPRSWSTVTPAPLYLH